MKPSANAVEEDKDIEKRDAARQQRIKSVIGTLLVIGAILLIPLFFAIRTAANPPAAVSTATLNKPAATKIPPSTGTTAKEPSPCTFPLAQVTATESAPENYTFSEPKIVLTAPKGVIYNVAQWLPDNQQVLMTEELRNRELGNSEPLQESINLYNPETGDVKTYAVRSYTNGMPSWVPDLSAVVYPTINYTSLDRKNGINKFTRQVWVSYGDPNTVKLLADNLSQSQIAVKPGGSETVYFSDKQISKLDKSLKKLSTSPFDPAQWDYARGRRNKNPILFKMAWQPDRSLIFLYSNGDMGGGGYTFVLNIDTGQICGLSLGGWATGARWSADGRYLAIGMATNAHPSELAVLDTETGNLETLVSPPKGIGGQLYIDDLLWTPDNRHLLVIGSVISPQATKNQGLYLVDTVSNQSIQAGKYESVVSSDDNNWAWSSDGSKLLMRCPTHEVDQICLISVSKTGQ